MFARVSTYQGSGESIERSLAQADELVPAIRTMEGSRGVIVLVDRASGKSISITLWESAEVMRASEEAADRMRRESSDAAGEAILGVERYEVAVFDVGHGP